MASRECSNFFLLPTGFFGHLTGLSPLEAVTVHLELDHKLLLAEVFHERALKRKIGDIHAKIKCRLRDQ